MLGSRGRPVSGQNFATRGRPVSESNFGAAVPTSGWTSCAATGVGGMPRPSDMVGGLFFVFELEDHCDMVGFFFVFFFNTQKTARTSRTTATPPPAPPAT